MNKNFFALLSLAFPLLLIGAGCGSQTTVSMTPSAPATNGKVVVSLTDDALDMGNVTDVALTENKIELHSDTNGWIVASTDTRTFHLLDLKAKNEIALVTSVDLPAGVYPQMRISVVRVVVTTKGGNTAEAKLPSGQIILNTPTIVEVGATTNVNLDVVADMSLHMTGNGFYIFSPVIKVQHRKQATLHIDDKDVVTIEGAEKVEEMAEGMDIDGMMKRDFSFDRNREMEISTEGHIRMVSSTKEKAGGLLKVKSSVNDGNDN